MAYRIGNIPGDAPDWLVRELLAIQAAGNSPVDGVVFNPLPAQPKKLFKGLTVVADGVNWDPLTLALGGEYMVSYLRGAWRRLDA